MTAPDRHANPWEQAQYWEDQCERAEALLSWIVGACVDELPHMEIRAAIDRYLWSGGERRVADGQLDAGH